MDSVTVSSPTCQSARGAVDDALEEPSVVHDTLPLADGTPASPPQPIKKARKTAVAATCGVKAAGACAQPPGGGAATTTTASTMAACPAHAVKSVIGQRMTMEDAWVVVPDLLTLGGDWCPATSTLDQLPIPPPPKASSSTRHLFAGLSASGRASESKSEGGAGEAPAGGRKASGLGRASVGRPSSVATAAAASTAAPHSPSHIASHSAWASGNDNTAGTCIATITHGEPAPAAASATAAAEATTAGIRLLTPDVDPPHDASRALIPTAMSPTTPNNVDGVGVGGGGIGVLHESALVAGSEPAPLSPLHSYCSLRSSSSFDAAASVSQVSALDSSDAIAQDAAQHDAHHQHHHGGAHTLVSLAADEADQQHLAFLPPSSSTSSSSSSPPFSAHFFAVYDGHGGADVAKHCATTLHEILRNVVARRVAEAAGGTAAAVPPVPPMPTPLSQAATAGSPRDSAPVASRGLFANMLNSPSGTSDGTGGSGDGSPRAASGGVPTATAAATAAETAAAVGPRAALEPALIQAFLEMDLRLCRAGSANDVGTTAVAALIGPQHIWIANCGDSRAVLCRDGEPVCLSLDHKATRGDEVARIEAAGGYVWWDRVMGELAISRAIGDHCLRPFVIAEPEVTRVTRRLTDQVLVLASDGLWDVLSNKDVCALALEKFQAEVARGSSSRSAVKRAASSLVKVALQRGTRDNVTVMVIDVRCGVPPAAAAPASPGEGVAVSGAATGRAGPHAAVPADERDSEEGGGSGQHLSQDNLTEPEFQTPPQTTPRSSPQQPHQLLQP